MLRFVFPVTFRDWLRPSLRCRGRPGRLNGGKKGLSTHGFVDIFFMIIAGNLESKLSLSCDYHKKTPNL